MGMEKKEKSKTMKFLKITLILLFIACHSDLNAQVVYTTKTGEKYHTKGCRYLKGSEKEVTLQRALDLGYTGCSVCKPPTRENTTKTTLSAPTVNKTSTSEKKATSSQCTGLTKSGSRCKRMTTNTNGKCYQHQ